MVNYHLGVGILVLPAHSLQLILPFTVCAQPCPHDCHIYKCGKPTVKRLLLLMLWHGDAEGTCSPNSTCIKIAHCEQHPRGAKVLPRQLLLHRYDFSPLCQTAPSDKEEGFLLTLGGILCSRSPDSPNDLGFSQFNINDKVNYSYKYSLCVFSTVARFGLAKS